LVVDHLSAYAALLAQETNDASKTLVTRVLVWLIALISVVICVVFSGIALMLGVLQNQFHWILVAVPGVMALCALGAFAYTKQNVVANHFSNIKSQFLSDSTALRLAASHQEK
jgi:type IV secretory pathway VirB2 component (pilin)